MFEDHREPLLTRPEFVKRMLRSVVVAATVATVSLGLGSVGYCYFADLDAIDGFLNASMILTGMGPVDKMKTTGGKLFAGIYALYSGMAFLTMMAVLVGPITHRMLHRFHAATDLEEERDEEDDDDDGESRGKKTPKKKKSSKANQ